MRLIRIWSGDMSSDYHSSGRLETYWNGSPVTSSQSESDGDSSFDEKPGCWDQTLDSEVLLSWWNIHSSWLISSVYSWPSAALEVIVPRRRFHASTDHTEMWPGVITRVLIGQHSQRSSLIGGARQPAQAPVSDARRWQSEWWLKGLKITTIHWPRIGWIHM